MNGTTWNHLMAEARRAAGANAERRKVVGVRTFARMERATGKRWIYVVQCGRNCDVCRIKRSRARG